MLLLSDGTVMVQHYNNDADTVNWYRLTPDTRGSYANGSWTKRPIASAHRSRVFYQSFVLPDGRVFLAGGEYGTGTNDAEVYDPLANTWTLPLRSPGPNILDASSELLPNGDALVAPWTGDLNPPFVTLIYHRASNTWSHGIASLASQNEATWIKLPDDSILTIDRGSTTTERYIPSLNQWIPDAPLPPPMQLWSTNIEIGAALLLPNGKAFFLGGTGQTALYTPSGSTNLGSWSPGAVIPEGRVTEDAPAATLVNGHVLCAVHNPGGDNAPPVFFYEYDHLTDSFTPVNSPTGGSSDGNIGDNRISLLALPDGTVLFNDTTSQLYVYTPNPTTPVAAAKPSILNITANIAGVSYHLTGTRLNGISAGAAFGDDAQMDSNYPLVRLTDSGGIVFYARTYNWSSTGVRTGSTPVSTEFEVPGTVPPGTYSLVVVANGIQSDSIAFTYNGPVWVDFNYTVGTEDGSYAQPYDTLAKGTNHVSSGGTIAIKPGSSPETMLIRKPMTITAVGGAATVGH